MLTLALKTKKEKMREKKVHLKKRNRYPYGACGTYKENAVEFEEFEFYTPKEKRCKNCLETNEYKNMLAEHESKRPLEENEFEEPVKSQLEIDAKKYKLGGELFGAFEKNDNYENTPEKYKLTIKNRNGESVVCDVYDIIESIGVFEYTSLPGFKKGFMSGNQRCKRCGAGFE